MYVSGSTFLVTGGSSGLGEACARRLASAGGNVVVADVNVARGAALAAELGGRARFIATDVTDEASVAKAVALAEGEFGCLQGLVNCAGVIAAARVVGKEGPHDLGLFARVLQVNLIGAFNVIRLAAMAMARSPAGVDGERGVIVNTASIAAFDGQIGQAAYAASKGGIVSLTLPLARELARHGIRVMTIAPGIFETPMMGQISDEVRKSLSEQVPFPQRLGHPDEFAALVEHIVMNPMLNGEVIRLDGAVRMAAK